MLLLIDALMELSFHLLLEPSKDIFGIHYNFQAVAK